MFRAWGNRSAGEVLATHARGPRSCHLCSPCERLSVLLGTCNSSIECRNGNSGDSGPSCLAECVSPGSHWEIPCQQTRWTAPEECHPRLSPARTCTHSCPTQISQINLSIMRAVERSFYLVASMQWFPSADHTAHSVDSAKPQDGQGQPSHGRVHMKQRMGKESSKERPKSRELDFQPNQPGISNSSSLPKWSTTRESLDCAGSFCLGKMRVRWTQLSTGVGRWCPGGWTACGGKWFEIGKNKTELPAWGPGRDLHIKAEHIWRNNIRMSWFPFIQISQSPYKEVSRGLGYGRPPPPPRSALLPHFQS